MTTKSRRPRHQGEGINATDRILQPPAPVVNVPFRPWPIGELAEFLEIRPAELRGKLDFIRDIHRRWSANPLIRPEAAARLFAQQREGVQDA